MSGKEKSDQGLPRSNKRGPNSPLEKSGELNKKRNTEGRVEGDDLQDAPGTSDQQIDDAILSIASKVGDCVTAQAEVTYSLNLQANRIADNSDEIVSLKAENRALIKRLDIMEATQRASSERIEQVERSTATLSHALKNINIVIDGLSELQGEDCKTRVTEILQIIEKKFHQDDIFAAYRIGQETENRPRSVVIKLYDPLVKQMLMEGKWKLMKDKRGDKIFLNDDLPPKMKNERRIIREICRYAHKKGYKDCKASGSKLSIEGKGYRFETLHLLPSELQMCNIKTRTVGNGIGFQGEESFLSNFYPITLTVEDILFSSAEQAFQHFKAKTCKKDETAAKILTMADPRKIKITGDDLPSRALWEDNKEAFMRSIVYAKFSQNEEIRRKLLDTKDTPLHECTKNRWWGCGWRLDAPEWDNENMSTYPGLNKLGTILMDVRTALRHDKSLRVATPKSPLAIIKSIQKMNRFIQDQSEPSTAKPAVNEKPEPMETATASSSAVKEDSTSEVEDEDLYDATDIEEDSVDISANSSINSKADTSTDRHNLTGPDGRLNLEVVKNWSIPKLDTSRLELSTSYIRGKRSSQRLRSTLSTESP